MDAAGHLRSIGPSGVPAPSHYNIDIIVVSDIRPRDIWVSSLLNLLSASAANAQVLLFEYSISGRTESSVWQILLKLSGDLLGSLEDRAQDSQRRRPIVFVCFGLGGIVLKHVLNLVYEQHGDFTSRLLRILLSGIVLLGTPHPTYKRRELWPQLTLILRACTNFNKKVLLQAEAQATIVANVSKIFEETGIDVPVLSAFETKKTNVKRGWLGAKRTGLVERVLAETSLKKEMLIPVDGDHGSIGELKRGSPVAAAVENLIVNAQQRTEDSLVINIDLGASNPLPCRVWADAAGSTTAVEAPDVPSCVENESIWDRHVMPQAQELVEQHKVPEMPCYMTHPMERNPSFYGRKDILLQLDAILLPSVGAVSNAPALRSCTLYGLGGLGKTQIAIEFAFSRKTHFDAIFWVRADEIAKMAESFNRIARTLGILDPLDVGDRNVSRNAVLEWLSNPRKASTIRSGDSRPLETTKAEWLMIFDNADNLELLHDYWPIGSHGSVLVTSRDPLAKTDLTSNNGIELSPLGIQDSAALLHKLLSQSLIEDDEANVLALSERLGGLPLVVDQVAAFIRRRTITVGEFLANYGAFPSVEVLKNAAPIVRQDRDRQTLSTVWQLEKFSPTALSLLGLLALLDPDRISEALLTQNVPAHVVEAYPLSGGMAFIDARTELLKASMVKRHVETKHLSLHRLVQEVAQNQMEVGQIDRCFTLAVHLLHSAWPNQYDSTSLDNEAWEASDEVVAHIVKVQHVYGTNSQMQLEIDIRRRFVDLLLKSGWYLVERSEFEAAEPMLRLAHQVCEKYVDDLSDLLIYTLFCLSKFGSWTNMKAAEIHALSSRQLELCLRADDGSIEAMENVATGQSNMGMACMLVGQFEDAVVHCQRSEELDCTSPDAQAGRTWPHFARIYCAWALSGLGENKKAARILLETLAFRERTYGANDTQSVKLGIVLQVLGYIRARQGLFSESFDAYQRALANFRATVGINHLSTGETCLKLAECHAAMSQPEAASVYFEQAMKVFRKDSYHKPELARTLYKQAKFYQQIGEARSAQQLYAQARAIYVEVVPAYNSDAVPSEDAFDGLVLMWSR